MVGRSAPRPPRAGLPGSIPARSQALHRRLRFDDRHVVLRALGAGGGARWVNRLSSINTPWAIRFPTRSCSPTTCRLGGGDCARQICGSIVVRKFSRESRRQPDPPEKLNEGALDPAEWPGSPARYRRGRPRGIGRRPSREGSRARESCLSASLSLAGPVSPAATGRPELRLSARYDKRVSGRQLRRGHRHDQQSRSVA